VAPLESEPCSVDASDPSLPGVTIHLEADRCDFFEGQGGQFRYRVEQTQSLDFNSPADDQGTGKCWELTDLVAWVSFVIGNETQSLYCPACDEGPCPPNDATAVTLPATELDRTVLWPGLQWHGESDTYEVPSGTFAPGAYTASVTMALPDLGEVKASLPITVVAAE
jgi:hypothetical protein